jgi:hypothetical protein
MTRTKAEAFLEEQSFLEEQALLHLGWVPELAVRFALVPPMVHWCCLERAQWTVGATAKKTATASARQ